MANLLLSPSNPQIIATPASGRTRNGFVRFGVNTHFNPAGLTYGTECTALLSDVGARATRSDNQDYQGWVSGGRTAYTSDTKWNSATGLQQELVAERTLNDIYSVGGTFRPIFNETGFVTNQNITDAVAFLTQYATALKAYTPYIEVTNETCNVSDTQNIEVLDFFKAINDQVRTAVPGTKILGPSGTWGFSNLSRHSAFWSNPRAPGIFDICAVHFYDQSRTPENQETSTQLDSLISPVPTGTQIWMTECGYDFSNVGVDAATVAKLYTRLWFIYATIGFDVIFAYQLVANPSAGPNFGIYSNARAALAQTAACRAAWRHIHACTQHRLYRPGGVVLAHRCYVWKGYDGVGERLAIWDPNNSTGRVTYVAVKASTACTLTITNVFDDTTDSTVSLTGPTSTNPLGIQYVPVTVLDKSKVLFTATPSAQILFPEYGN